jgi:hypothetical protein|tara:strand:+ start:4913 stop:5530 length:618 start_codon:yes stop_codon:yes gene_type:complete
MIPSSTPNTFYKHVIVDIPHNYMKTVVGKKGANLKNYCKQYKVNNIWFNMNRNLVEIWGPKESLSKVASAIEERITKIKKHIPDNELSEFQSKFNVPQDVFTSGTLDDTIARDNVKFLIGRNGINFKKITRLSNVSYIWYNDTTHAIDIWGPKENIQAAVGMLFSMITSVNGQLQLKKQQQDDKIVSTISYPDESVHGHEDMCIE